MRTFRRVVLVLALSCLADIFANSGATAQTIYFGVHDIALKNGESSELALHRDKLQIAAEGPA